MVPSDSNNEIKVKGHPDSIRTFNSNICVGLSRGEFLIMIDNKGNVLKEVKTTFEIPYYINVANDIYLYIYTSPVSVVIINNPNMSL
jgi:hypothetical protein